MHANTQRHRNSFDVVERDVPRLALDVPDERAVQARFECQRLLWPCALLTFPRKTIQVKTGVTGASERYQRQPNQSIAACVSQVHTASCAWFRLPHLSPVQSI